MDDREKLESITPEEEDDGDMFKAMRDFMKGMQEADFDEEAFAAGLKELTDQIDAEEASE